MQRNALVVGLLVAVEVVRAARRRGARAVHAAAARAARAARRRAAPAAAEARVHSVHLEEEKALLIGVANS